MITLLIWFSVSLLWTGLTDGSEVTQNPFILWGQKGTDITSVYLKTLSPLCDQSSLSTTINMIHLLIHVVTLLLWMTGLSLTDKVHQTPTEILKEPGDEVQLTCTHTDTSYYMILWYQQSVQNPALKLIGNKPSLIRSSVP
ncbi:hypothetical protein DPEC_G00312920 [Dallia pectoralis]|uniref:Uncharacterized protein n=1 Tax=Dallia pectoralis TaxID=75939 RepID=A0ACC2FBQ5_DALPE|nr:hypothetical protein DPEC_G00312920 [Dallia pectoralis]